ncbi:cell division protein ZipA [Chromatiales bacterium (ex Bugula neritina AB1)]|nr:cell division protein ZipA [Chromatiales bacterium (ex Bugula neritina AB1)]
MEFFRWMLILLGVALLAATFFLGRRNVDRAGYRRTRKAEDFDPSVEDLSVPITGRLSDSPAYDGGYADDEEFLSDKEIDSVIPVRDSNDIANTHVDLDDVPIEGRGEKTGRTRRGGMESVKSFATAVKQASQRTGSHSRSGATKAPAVEGFSAELETYSESSTEPEEKLVTVHVTAPREQKFSGRNLKAAFENHGYEFGKMSIYHCRYDNHKVFSVANMLRPGSFDNDAMDSFQTPGITLFMRLPVSLDADVAFDFLISEATELADELGGQLRDADRSTLSKQTIQHMREDIQQYVFRQKRAAKV